MLKVLTLGSKSTPVFSSPPLSLTWKVKFARLIPLALSGIKLKFAISAASTSVPAVMVAAPSFKTPFVGKVVILTAARLLLMPSISLKPKSDSSKV